MSEVHAQYLRDEASTNKTLYLGGTSKMRIALLDESKLPFRVHVADLELFREQPQSVPPSGVPEHVIGAGEQVHDLAAEGCVLATRLGIPELMGDGSLACLALARIHHAHQCQRPRAEVCEPDRQLRQQCQNLYQKRLARYPPHHIILKWPK